MHPSDEDYMIQSVLSRRGVEIFLYALDRLEAAVAENDTLFRVPNADELMFTPRGPSRTVQSADGSLAKPAADVTLPSALSGADADTPSTSPAQERTPIVGAIDGNLQ